MTVSVQQVLNSFDALSDNEKREAALALLQRILRDVPGDLPEEILVAAAEELFLELDAIEASDGRT
jgi:hypothetical protein